MIYTKFMEPIQPSFEHFSFIVDAGQSTLRIDKYLSDRIGHISRMKIKEAGENNFILVNEHPVKVNYKIKPGDKIKLMLPFPPTEIDVIPEDIPLDIIYEDESILIINKPAGMVVHPSFGHYSGTLINALAHYLKDLAMFNKGELRPGLIHRIDKNTSGLLVVAKTENSKQQLALQFLHKSTERTYLALIWGSPKDKTGTITGNIGRHYKNRKIMDVYSEDEIGKHAVTHYRVIESFDYVSVVECKLETGRTHQIRVHFKHIKHPIFNDVDYGGDVILRGTVFTKYKQFVKNCFAICPRQALHAKSLGIVHPKTNKFMQFNSPLPSDMTLLLRKWRTYVANREIYT